MTNLTTHITHEPQDVDAWVCLCGNMPSDDGFYSCTIDGVDCEPDHEWNGIYYKCNNCAGRIDQTTLEIKHWCVKCKTFVDIPTMIAGDICNKH